MCSARLRSSTQSRVNAFGAEPGHLKYHSCSASYSGLYFSRRPSIRAKPPQLSPDKTADHRRFIPPWSSIFAILLGVPGGACLSCSFLAHFAHAVCRATECVSLLPSRSSVYTRNVPPSVRYHRIEHHVSVFAETRDRRRRFAPGKALGRLGSTGSLRRACARSLALRGGALAVRPGILAQVCASVLGGQQAQVVGDGVAPDRPAQEVGSSQSAQREQREGSVWVAEKRGRRRPRRARVALVLVSGRAGMHPLGGFHQRLAAVGGGVVHGAVVRALVVDGDGEGEVSALACCGGDMCVLRVVWWTLVEEERLAQASAAKSNKTAGWRAAAGHTPEEVPILPSQSAMSSRVLSWIERDSASMQISLCMNVEAYSSTQFDCGFD